MRLDLVLVQGDLARVVQSAPKFSQTGEIRDNFIGVAARLARAACRRPESFSWMDSAGCENGSNRSLECEAVGGAQLRASAVGESRGGSAECTGGGLARARSGGFVGWFARSSQLGLRPRLDRGKERAGAESARRLRRPLFGGAVSTSYTDAHFIVPIMRRHPDFFRSRRPAVRSAAQRPEEQRAAVLKGSAAEGGGRSRAPEWVWPGLSCSWSGVPRQEIIGGKARGTKSPARRIRRSVQGFVATPASATPVACTLRR